MTATLPNRRADRKVSPAPSRITPGAAMRAVVFAFLLSLSSFAVAGAQESTPASTPVTASLPLDTLPKLELTLDELNDSGITGTVTLYDTGEGKTVVKFDVQGAGGDHPAHIHQGVCGDLDPEPSQSLQNIDANGESTTIVDVTLDDLLAGNYAVDMHLAPDELGTMIACANIEGEPEVPASTTPVASPEATPNEGVGGTVPTETPSNSNATVTETPESDVSDGTGGTTTEIVGQGDRPTTAPAGGDGTTGPGTTVQESDQTSAPTAGDGTSGISGKGEPVDTSTLPQKAGVGSALEWPEGPALTTMLASLAAAILLGTGGWFVRRGEHQASTTPSRWNRLGI